MIDERRYEFASANLLVDSPKRKTESTGSWVGLFFSSRKFPIYVPWAEKVWDGHGIVSEVIMKSHFLQYFCTHPFLANMRTHCFQGPQENFFPGVCARQGQHELCNVMGGS